MQLVLSITFLIFLEICGVLCVKLAHSILGDRGDMFITHLIIIVIKSEVSTCPIIVIFFSGCVPEAVVPSYAVGFIYIPGKLGFVSFITVQSYDVHK